MKFLLIIALLCTLNFGISLITPKKLIKKLQNGPISSPFLNPNQFNSYPDYRFSQTNIQETSEISEKNQLESENSAAEQVGAEKPIFTLNIHAPQESTEDIIGNFLIHIIIYLNIR